MGTFSRNAGLICDRALDEYHIIDSFDHPVSNPFSEGCFKYMWYQKSWIDIVQWHLEDEIRRTDIDPVYALQIKRRIDLLNQERTNKVEAIEDCFLKMFAGIKPEDGARKNTESPGWALDRLSILHIKIYHMKMEVLRPDASIAHSEKCGRKLAVLNEQKIDLDESINDLLREISEGRTCMRAYRQLKMYNDHNLNPVLYRASKL
jgi:uncharacterized protein DUF4254